MLSVMLLASLTLGYQETVSLMETKTHVMADAEGRRWTHQDPAALIRWVEERNRQIRAGTKPTPSKDAPINYGIDPTKLPKQAKGKAWYGGNVPASYQSGGDKAKRLHLTVIGDGAGDVVKRWRDDPSFKSLEESMGDRLAVQAFEDANNPLVKDVGLPNGGRPDVVIQEGSGKVVYRAKADPGATAIVGEVRRRDPNYDPSRDPTGGVTADTGRLLIWGGVLAVLFFAYRSQASA